MARIAFRAYREPFLRRLMNSRYYTFVYSNGRRKTLENTNKLLARSAMFNGMKTGYTFAAGRCSDFERLGGRARGDLGPVWKQDRATFLTMQNG